MSESEWQKGTLLKHKSNPGWVYLILGPGPSRETWTTLRIVGKMGLGTAITLSDVYLRSRTEYLGDIE